MNALLVRLCTGLLLLAGCSDLATQAPRTPSGLRLDTDTAVATEGEAVAVGFTVVDQHARPFERIPDWLVPVWSTADSQRVRVEGASLRFVRPGQTVARVGVAGITGSLVARVNPRRLTLQVRGAYLTQGTQRLDGSVPLVAGRDALLRVFLAGDQPAYFKPRVRVRLFGQGVLQRTLELEPDVDSIPLRVAQGTLRLSWNAAVPGSLVQPGLSYVVEADPEGRVPLAAGSATRFPASGAEVPTVRPVPRLQLRLIPITQTTPRTTGGVSNANRESFVALLRELWPVGEFDVDVREPYVTTQTLTDRGGGWNDLIQEVRALRVADGSDRHYYGVVRTTYNSGVAGLGYLGFPTAIGWDNRNPADVLAHELGHNFGLRHAPCGGAAGVDPAFPYPEALVGVYGYRGSSGEVVNPDSAHDVMSYCRPQWISDYNYVKALELRERAARPGAAGALEPALLLWGRVGDGEPRLEPAFELPMRPSLPAGDGPYRIEGFDQAGVSLFRYGFDVEALDHADARPFAFAIPARVAQPERLARLRLTAPGGEAWQVRGPAGLAPAPALRAAGGRATLSWSGAHARVALVRDARTGAVISFARGGSLVLPAGERELEVLLSDGVRSTRHRVRSR